MKSPIKTSPGSLAFLFLLAVLFLPIDLYTQGQIVFRSDRSSSARLYIMNSDGTGLRLLESGDPLDEHADTTAAYAAASPQWSPDGRQIVFYTYWGSEKGQTDGQDIVIINADGTNRKRLTTNGYNTDPAWSPDGSQIVFRALKDQNWGLYLLDVQTGSISLLIDTPFMDRAPHWSPDGKKILFSSGYGSNRESGEDIYMVNADGSGLQQLTNRAGEESLAEWSPDGQSIIFNAETDSTTQLFIMRADGGEQRQLTTAGVNYSASFSSDGQKIVYVSYVNNNSEIFTLDLQSNRSTRLTNNTIRDNGGDWFVSIESGKIVFQSRKNGNDEICVMNEDGSDIVNLSKHQGEDRRPWWSADGERIFFETNRNGHWDIFSMNKDGSDPRPVLQSEAEEKYPGLSYDGKKIAFIMFRGEKTGLYIMNSSGEELRALTQFSVLGPEVYENYPSWSPDGRIICFGSNRDTKIAPTREGGKGLEIYTMNADGTEPKRLTFNKEEDSLPVFSPDGSKILFNSSRTGQYHLYTMLPDGREVTPLSWGNHSNWSARFSRDGQKIVFVSNRSSNSDVYLMGADGRHVCRLTFNGTSSSPDFFRAKN